MLRALRSSLPRFQSTRSLPVIRIVHRNDSLASSRLSRRYLSYDPEKVRNVAIIAHVDHGKDL